jgi:hypothetical protein
VAYRPVARQRPQNKQWAKWLACPYNNRVTVGNGVMQPVAKQLQ